MRRRGTGLILEAIEPSRQSADEDELKYPHLRAALKAYAPTSYLERGMKLIKNPRKLPKVGQQLSQELNSAYLLMASYRLQKALTPVDKFFWSQQFTLASISLFGRPDSRQVRTLAADELKRFEAIVENLDNHHDFTGVLLHAYRSLARGAKNHRRPNHKVGHVLEQVKHYFEQRYVDSLAVFDEYDDEYEFAPNELRKCFRRALERLAEDDPAWRNWRVASDASAGLSVEAPDKKIVVGRERAPIAKSDVRGLFAHEVLVHANRAMQGAKLSVKLSEGLEDYLDAEEGLGVLAEAAVNGEIPDKIKDRYLDIALAMGNYRRRPVPREKLYHISYVRAVLRGLRDGEDIDLDELENITWQHVNRIYRGSLGDKYVAVFTKDIAYYQGFNQMADYVKKELKTRPIEQVMAYVLKGKFDPTNAKHAKRVRSLTKQR